MAQISLHDYLKDVDALIRRDKYEEALGHTRQILLHYPKNANGYRLLGRVLVAMSRWEEAADVLRRLLGAYPNDFLAHFQLSIAYEGLKQPEQALWHIERAFDQEPNNADVIKRLRTLYMRVREQEVTRIQLTSGAVASQYLQSGLFEQAVEVLREAIQRMPDRSDLRLKLAVALWRIGRQVDSAELAIDLLSEAPYAVEANQILTELWLQEQRPSDAQRYLSRIEDIAPYLAMRLATNDNVAANVFMLEELDYAQYTTHELSTQRPDWLSSIDSNDFSQIVDEDTTLSDDEIDALLNSPDDWLDGVDEASQEPRKKVTDELPDLLPDAFMIPDAPSDERDGLDFLDDVLNDDGSENDKADSEIDPDILKRIETLKGASNTETTLAGSGTGLTDLLNDISEDETNTSDDTSRTSTGLTGMLSELENNDDSWLDEVKTGSLDTSVVDNFLANQSNNETSDVNRASTGLTGMFEEQADENLDDLLNDIDFKSDEVDNRASTGLTGMFDDVPDEVDNRASTGLTGMFEEQADENLDSLLDDIDFESDDPSRSSTGLTGMFSNDDESNDPNAWMNDLGVELDEEASNPLEELVEGDDDFVVPQSVEQEDSLAWMSDVDVELSDEMIAQQMEDELKPINTDDDEDPNAWMNDLGIELDNPIEDINATDDLDIKDNAEFFIEENTVSDVPDLFADDTDTTTNDGLDNMVAGGMIAGGVIAGGMLAANAENDSDDNEENDLPDFLANNIMSDDEFSELVPTDALNDETVATRPDEWGEDDILQNLLDFEDLDDKTIDAGEIDRQDSVNDGQDWLNDFDDDDLSDGTDDGDSMAWLNDLESADEPTTQSDLNLDDFDDASSDDEEDPLAWMADAGIQLDDDTDDNASAVAVGDSDWLNDEGLDDFLNDSDFDNMPSVSADLTTNPAAQVADLQSSDSDSFDFFDGVSDDETSDNFDDTMNDFSMEDDNSSGSAGLLDWMGDDDNTDAGWLAESNDSDEDIQNTDATLVDSGWLNELDIEDVENEADLVLDETGSANDFLSDETELTDITFKENDELGDNLLDEFPENADLLDDADWFGNETEDTSLNDDDWLNELDAVSEDSTSVSDDSEAVGQPEWLNLDFDDQGEEITSSSDEFGEVSDFDSFTDDAIAEESGADWLSDISDFGDEPSNDDGFGEVSDFDSFTDDAIAEENGADWLSDVSDFGDEPSNNDGFGEVSDFDSFTDETTNNEELDWMVDSGLENFDDEPVSSDDFGDLGDFETEQDAVTNDADWLNDIGVADDTDDVMGEFESETVLDDFSDFDTFDDSSSVVDESSTLADNEATGQPDWLNLDFDSEDDIVENEPIQSEPDWLSNMSSFDNEDDVDISDDVVDDFEPTNSLQNDNEPDWLNSMSGFDGDEERFDEVDDNPDWLRETGSFDASELVSNAIALQNDNPVEDSDFDSDFDISDDFNDNFDSFDDEFGSDFDTTENDIVDDSVQALSISDEFSGDFETTDEFDNSATIPMRDALDMPSSLDEIGQEDFEEELEVTSAMNAPDWLNAMVPGLDLDFEAQEDEPIDKGFVAEALNVRPYRPTFRRIETKEFDWLLDIIDQEESATPLAPTPPVAPPPVPIDTLPDLPAVQKYRFTKLPLWMREQAPPPPMPSATTTVAVAATTVAAASATNTNKPDFDDDDWDDFDDDFDDIDFDDFDDFD